MIIAEEGEIANAGSRLITAEAFAVELAALVAVIEIVCAAATLAGAVYVAVIPEITTDPTLGLSVHVTPVFVEPVTVAVRLLA